MLLQIQCVLKSEKEGQTAAMEEAQFGLVTDVSALEEGALNRSRETERGRDVFDGW